MGRGLFLGGQPCPHPNGVGPQRFIILRVIYEYTVCRRITKFDVTWGGGVNVLASARSPSQESRVPVIPNF